MRVQKMIKPDVNILCLNYNRSWTESFLSLECNAESNLPLNVTITDIFHIASKVESEFYVDVSIIENAKVFIVDTLL